MQALVVGGDAHECATLVDHLRRGGYDTVMVTSARDARDAIDQTPFDVLVLDLSLPNSAGLRLCEEIRTRLGDGPVIMFVGNSASRSKHLVGFELGADDFLDSPCDGDELLARMEARLRRRSLNSGPFTSTAVPPPGA